MIMKSLLLTFFFQVYSCNEEQDTTMTTTTTTTLRPSYAINTTSGDVAGYNLTFKEGNVTEYLGVPYAYPPMHSHRFLPPVKLLEPAWNGTRYCIHLANSCMQPLINDTFEGYNYTNPKKNISEDCLQLNMWVPGNKSRATVVFLLGESFSFGSPSLDFNNGSMLALKSKAIVVNIGYRLGIFGFAYLNNSEHVRGNMGLLDQQVAMEWIYKNIERFGGNKSMITLYGSSAGAASATAHLFSNNSRNLFSRAIIVSGVITSFFSTVSRDEANHLTRTAAEWLNCTENDNDTALLKCLQNKTAEELVNITYEIDHENNEPYFSQFRPIDNDTIFFNGSFLDKLNHSIMKNDSDIIFGRTQDEATIHMPFNLQELNCTFNSTLQQIRKGKKKLKLNSCSLNETGLEYVANMTAEFFDYGYYFAKNLTAIYNKTKTNKTRGKVARMLSDIFFDCKLSKFAEYYYNSSKAFNRSVYFFEFRKHSVVNPWPKWMGAMQGWELEYVFGYPHRYPHLYKNITGNGTLVRLEKRFSTILMKQIGNFSKKGIPGDAWLKFNETVGRALVINGNLSEVKYIKQRSRKCVKLDKLFDDYVEVDTMEEWGGYGSYDYENGDHDCEDEYVYINDDDEGENGYEYDDCIDDSIR